MEGDLKAERAEPVSPAPSKNLSVPQPVQYSALMDELQGFWHSMALDGTYIKLHLVASI